MSSKMVRVEFNCQINSYRVHREYIIKKIIAEKYEMNGYLRYMREIGEKL